MITQPNKMRPLNEYTKVLYMIDMNNGFVNFGPMANQKYLTLVPEQMKMIKKFRQEHQLVNFILEGHDKEATEFKQYPSHCVVGTKEAELIPEFTKAQHQQDTQTYYKNCINGMLNKDVQQQIRELKNVREIIFEGVCADLCVMDFARTCSRFLDEINHEAKLFVVKDAIDTFDAPGHNREEWIDIALKVMSQAGIEVVKDIEELEQREKQLGLYIK